MSTVNINLLHSESECDTCGYNYDCGGIVTIDNNEVFRYEPGTSCFGGKHMDLEDLLSVALHKLGHTLIIDDEIIEFEHDGE